MRHLFQLRNKLTEFAMLHYNCDHFSIWNT